MLTFDLADEVAALRGEAGWRTTGHSARTLAKHHDFRTVLVAMKRADVMKEHEASGAISIQVLAGRLRIHVGKQAIELPSGHLLALDRSLPHDVEALEDSAFVLSVCTEPKRRTH